MLRREGGSTQLSSPKSSPSGERDWHDNRNMWRFILKVYISIIWCLHDLELTQGLEWTIRQRGCSWYTSTHRLSCSQRSYKIHIRALLLFTYQGFRCSHFDILVCLIRRVERNSVRARDVDTVVPKLPIARWMPMRTYFPIKGTRERWLMILQRQSRWREGISPWALRSDRCLFGRINGHFDLSRISIEDR